MSAEPIEEGEPGEELAEIIEHDDPSAEIEAAAATLFRTNDPAQVVENASAVATVLAAVIRKQKLANTISGREFVKVEGWTLAGSMLGVFPIVEWTREVIDGVGEAVGWEARVEAKTRSGEVVGSAEAECLRSEKTWAKRDSYALRSMAQTRATSKALRGPLGFIMTMAGYESTPESEMPPDPEIRHDGRKPPTIATSNNEWLERMAQLEVPNPEYWARAAAAATGLGKSALLQKLNRVLLTLTDGDYVYDPFGPDPTGTIQAAFAMAFDGLFIEAPPLPPATPPPGQTDPHANEEGS